MTIETSNSEELLKSFRERYSGLIEENQKLTQKIKENEIQAIKLLGAIETLEYLEASTEQPVENVEE
jgi:ferritin-like metal-binding protein YciE